MTNKITLIIQREFLSRVRKKSFIWLTFLGPLLFGALMVVPAFLADVTTDEKIIEIVDESGLFSEAFQASSHLKYVFLNEDIEYIKQVFLESPHDGLLYLPKLEIDQPTGIILYCKSSPSLETMQQLQWIVKSRLEQLKFSNAKIDTELMNQIKATKVEIATVNLSGSDEQKKNVAAATAIGLLGAIMIYLFIFIYGAQVMRGVIEEKTNRIVEVIITSVRPFELMMGKIIGIACVALTQFVLWIVLTLLVTGVISSRFQTQRFSNSQIAQTLTKTPAKDFDKAMEINRILSVIDGIDVGYLILVFMCYFLLGYLLYAAMFAAIGAAVDNETDTQQFMLPITIPLVMSFVFAQNVLQDPSSTLSFWLSMIPFTSPIIMMVRLPFGVPLSEILGSLAILMLIFVVITWLSAKIYRIGIVMYGQKTTYNEIRKWIFYS